MSNSLCVITPTTGRPSLESTLASAALSALDEWLVISDGPQPDVKRLVSRLGAPYLYIEGPPSGNWGNRLRDIAMTESDKDWFIFLDDDDIFAPGAIEAIRRRLEDIPPTPVIFKIRQVNGRVLWQTPALHTGNIGGSMLVAPNVKGKLGKWDNGAEYGSDAQFIKDTVAKWGGNVLWVDEVIILCRPGGG